MPFRPFVTASIRKVQESTGNQIDEGVRASEKAIRAHVAGLDPAHHDHKTHMTDIARRPEMRGVHLKHLMKAADNLHKKGEIHYDGVYIGKPHAKESVDESLYGFAFGKWHAHGVAKELSAKHQTTYHVHLDKEAHNPKRAHGFARADVKTPPLGKKVASYTNGNAVKVEGVEVDESADHRGEIERAADHVGSTHMVLHSPTHTTLHFTEKKWADAAHEHFKKLGHKPEAPKKFHNPEGHYGDATHTMDVHHAAGANHDAGSKHESIPVKPLPENPLAGLPVKVAGQKNAEKVKEDAAPEAIEESADADAGHPMYHKPHTVGGHPITASHGLWHQSAESLKAAAPHLSAADHLRHAKAHFKAQQSHQTALGKAKTAGHTDLVAHHARMASQHRHLSHVHAFAGGHVPPERNESEERSFLDRVIGVVSIVEDAEATATIPDRSAIGTEIGEASAAFADIIDPENLMVETLSAEDHVVHVKYHLRSTEQAKKTVHHLVGAAMNHGAHGHDAEGYDGHVKFHFRHHDAAKHFANHAKAVAHVHTVAHAKPDESVEVSGFVPYDADVILELVSESAVLDEDDGNLDHEGNLRPHVVKSIEKTVRGAKKAGIAHDKAVRVVSAAYDRFGAKDTKRTHVWAKMAAHVRAMKESADAAEVSEAVVHLTTDMGQAAPTLDTMLASFGGKVAEGGGYQFPDGRDQAFLNMYMVHGGSGYIKVPKSAANPDGKAGPNESVDEALEPHHMAALKPGDKVSYNDGRPGHQGVHGHVVSNHPHHAVIHFADRAEPNIVKHSDKGWTKHMARHESVELSFLDRVMEAARVDESMVHVADLHAKAPWQGFEKSAADHMYHLKKPGKTVTVRAHASGAAVAVHRDKVGDVAIPSVTHQHPTVDAALAHAKKLHTESVDETYSQHHSVESATSAAHKAIQYDRRPHHIFKSSDGGVHLTHHHATGVARGWKHEKTVSVEDADKANKPHESVNEAKLPGTQVTHHEHLKPGDHIAYHGPLNGRTGTGPRVQVHGEVKSVEKTGIGHLVHVEAHHINGKPAHEHLDNDKVYKGTTHEQRHNVIHRVIHSSRFETHHDPIHKV